MSVSSTGWFRWHRCDAAVPPPEYPRIASAEDDPPAAATTCDLFAFDAPASVSRFNARIERILPVRAAASRDVLWLASQAAWPAEHPIIGALAAAWREHGDEPPPPTGIWHLSTGRGIHGYLNNHQVLIGNERLMRDGGIPLPEDIRATLADYAARGLQALLVGARSSPPEREDVHCSLIGILAVAPEARTQEAPTAPDAVPAAPPPSPRIDPPTAPALRGAQSDPPQTSRRRLGHWRLIGALAILSAAMGIYESAMTVAPDESAIVRRFGRTVNVCGPGLHFRSMWPVENVVRIRPHGTRLLQLETNGASPARRSVRAAIEYRVGESDADRIAYATAPAEAEALLARIAEATLHEALAASTAPELSLDWRRRMNERLVALSLGLEVVSASMLAIEPETATLPASAPSNLNLVEQACAAAAQSVNEAKSEASEALSDTWITARQARTEAATEASAGAEAALQEAADLLTRCGGPGASLEAARLALIREAMDSRLPGRRSRIVDPALGAGCRMYLLKGSGLEAASLWTWPSSQPALPEGGRP